MKKNIALFGCGYIYEKYRNSIPDENEVAVILDNDVTYHGTFVDGVKRIYPREIFDFNIDTVILMSDSAEEMREQLLRLGYDDKKIIHYKEFLGSLTQKREAFLCEKKETKTDKSALIISNELGYHGAPIVVFGMAECMRRMGYSVSVAASEGTKAFINEMYQAGVEVLLQENLEHASWENLIWVEKYDIVIVNSLPMAMCAITISKHKKVMLYLHENPDTYFFMRYWWDEINVCTDSDNINMCVVSDRARENFRRFFSGKKEIGILPPYVKDIYDRNRLSMNNTVTFAVIGPIMERKGQLAVLDAIESLKEEPDARFLFIGENPESDYSGRCLKRISGDDHCVYFGEKTRDEMRDLYQSIDAVIVPSTEETLSLAAAEAMMMGKVCIVSDHCGIAEYIDNGKNGYVFPLKNMGMLYEVIEYCIEHKEEMSKIGSRARHTYEEFFSSEVFIKRMEGILEA